MLPPFSFTNTFLFFSLFFFPTTHGAASDAEEGGYTACAPFSCGNFTNISYPFWNSNHQPGYCGHPKFKLDCNQEGNLTTIDINTHKFLVLEINQKSKLLKIARLDLLWGGDDDPYSCPKQYINVTVDSAFFNYTSNDDDYTLLFDCDAPLYTSSVNSDSSILFSCLIDGDPDKLRDGYLVLSTKVVDFNVLGCKNSINVPVLKGVFQSSLEDDLPVEDVLVEGFEVGWNWSGVDGDKCDGCIKTGGRCGYNASKNSFLCLCPNSNYLQSNGGVCRKTPLLSQFPAPTTSSSSSRPTPSRTLEPPYAPNSEQSESSDDTENIIAAFQSSQKTVLAISGNTSEAQIFLEALEHGLDGIVLKVDDVEPILELKEYFDRRTEESNLLSLTKATVTNIQVAGMGDRLCVDLCSLMRPGEGLLVGSFARGLFLVHSECLESNYIASRPFRVNAGPVHAYVAVPGGRTCYLSELKSGKEVIVVDQQGRQRIAIVGRVKIESRPLILVEAQRDSDNKTISILLQNAETVALVCPPQRNTLSKTAVPVTSLKVGDEVLLRVQGGAQHTGIDIQEFIVEK